MFKVYTWILTAPSVASLSLGHDPLSAFCYIQIYFWQYVSYYTLRKVSFWSCNLWKLPAFIKNCAFQWNCLGLLAFGYGVPPILFSKIWQLTYKILPFLSNCTFHLRFYVTYRIPNLSNRKLPRMHRNEWICIAICGLFYQVSFNQSCYLASWKIKKKVKVIYNLT